MILDILDNADFYVPLNPHLATAFAFLRRPDLAQLETGRHEVDDDVYAVVARGKGRKVEDALIETHDHYLDLQYVISGTDTMGWKARRDLGPTTEAYDPRSDVAFYKDAPTAWAEVAPGAFAIFFPEDAHLPMISDGELHKVIMKVRV
ncbi:YhcH/YjgK/YiaL family protein [Pseudodesulfovibrio portus]|uniref:Beta-D-galactosidase n=1 Tax=Pseudodesulfovibrio portus TaxID=231439 RepID=A0ABM8AV52_9BACT|nr:YhcH/YjgK/YiaL family protein [Pseudodesulfovibrio portus]BDQ35384.1 beta-D-galactosidase [Pseudodesulfovibrio portus]